MNTSRRPFFIAAAFTISILILSIYLGTSSLIEKFREEYSSDPFHEGDSLDPESGYYQEHLSKSQTLPYHFDYYGRLWEFHPDYIKITDIAIISNDYSVSTIRLRAPSLYSAADIYDIEVSDNIRTYEKEIKKISWRDSVYDEITFSLYPDHIINPGEKFPARISYKTRRLPHLHTPKNISPGEEQHLGINSGGTGLDMDRRVHIVAIPEDSDIKDVFQYLPTRVENIDGWKLYFYDFTSIERQKERVSMHIRFTINSDSPPVNYSGTIFAYPEGDNQDFEASEV